MNESDRSFAEAILNRIMKGGSINGMRFFTPQLLIDGPSDIRQEAFINLESSWVLFESLPETLPEKIEEMSREQEELEILKLKGEEIEKINILSPNPHLLINFKSGRALYLNGESEMYEPWTAGLTTHGNSHEHWLVVACPGGGLAVWAPEKWQANA
ncbi:MAG: hypothetical protein EOO52_07000 [Gammaproteobacteria bacterium]|nr:MAG: hypothetical protein EOO52_07000 [Gammaproteobacteria bacterium]